MNRNSEEILATLNKEAAWGGKKNSLENIHYWKGGKLHRDVTDNGLLLNRNLCWSRHSRFATCDSDGVDHLFKNKVLLRGDGHSSKSLSRVRDTCRSYIPKKPKGGVKIPLELAKKKRALPSIKWNKASNLALPNGREWRF